MKILIVASNMVHIKNFHRPYIDAFKSQGHNVYVMASGEGADFNIPFKKRAISFKNWKLSAEIKKIIKKEQFDIIYLHTTLAAFWTRYAIKNMKKRPIVVNTVHGYLFGNGFSFLHNKIYLGCEKIVKKATDYIVVMNDEDKLIAEKHKLALNKVYKIDGMGVEPFKRIFTEANPHVPPRRLVYVGEISKRKNQIFLVRAMKKLPDMELTLVGDGSQRKTIEKYIKKHRLEDRVFITGFTSNVGEYLASSDAYVSASTVEGLPFNIIEAMCAKLPIIASNVKGQNDILPSECLYETGDLESYINMVKTPPGVYVGYEKYDISSVFSGNMQIYLECADISTPVPDIAML